MRSEFFDVERLGEGIYAAIVKDGTGALGNAGIVDLGDRTMVFDTFQSMDAAADLRKVAEQLTGKHVSMVVNSHWHLDHVGGNQVFQDAVIVSTIATRSTIADRIPKFLDFAKAHPEYPEQLRASRNETMDAASRWELERDIGDVEHISNRIHDYVVTLPTVTFVRELVVHGTARSAQLLCSGGGHSVSDAFLYLPDDRVAFLGDLVFIGYHPSMKTGDPWRWIEILNELEKLEIDIVFTGHGPIGTKEAIPEIRQYIETCIQIAKELVDKNADRTAALSVTIPHAYEAWRGKGVFSANIAFLYDFLST